MGCMRKREVKLKKEVNRSGERKGRREGMVCVRREDKL